uniref:Uncharacterized protein n=1 Tax=Anguilla anguilla TaxID=7936 RepID=A0A0E9VI15_ANGAN
MIKKVYGLEKFFCILYIHVIIPRMY